MREYAVRLQDEAEEDLAALWTAAPAPARARITRADAEADRVLRQDPTGNGTALPEGLYRLTVGPLNYLYSVDETARTVEVSAIHGSGR